MTTARNIKIHDSVLFDYPKRGYSLFSLYKNHTNPVRTTTEYAMNASNVYV